MTSKKPNQDKIKQRFGNQKYIFKNETNWKPWFTLAGTNLILLLFTIFFTLIFGDSKFSMNFSLSVGFMFLFFLICGLLLKNMKRVIIIKKNYTPLKTAEQTEGITIYYQLGSLKIATRVFKTEEIKRFEIVEKEISKGKIWFSALVLKSGVYLMISTWRDQSFVYHRTTELNEFLLSNTDIDKNILTDDLVPYIPKGDLSKIEKKWRRKLIIFVTSSSVGVGLEIILTIRVLGIFPTIFIVFAIVFMNLIMLANNGAYLHGT